MDIWDDKQLQKQISKIPTENLLKFYLDLQKLVGFAQRIDYEDFDFKF